MNQPPAPSSDAQVLAPALAHAVADLQGRLHTRTVSEFATEARIDGESLQQALERYEIDYAWHVFASDRLRDQTVSVLEARLKRSVDAAQKACVSDILRTAAAAQASDRLMSFDNDVAEQLADRLSADWALQAAA